METPCLRLKFTPLLTNAVVDKAKCCLEIVPEVTCVQNLDKISWKQDNELVEYTIPMTYKIIIRKRDKPLKTASNVEAQCEKTYYSCVDLTPTSSTMSFFASCRCGVTKIRSDTILHNIKSKVFFCESLTNVNKGNCTKIIQNECPTESIADYNKQNMLNNRNKFPEEPIVHEILAVSMRDKKATEDNNSILEDEIVNPFIDKITNTEDVIKKTYSVKTITDICARGDEPKKLSLTPIYSFDTDKLPCPEIVFKPLTYVVNHILECVPKDVATRLPTRNKKQFNLRNMYEWDDWSNKNLCRARKRELPEERVAKFIKKMETEIMPLKLLLNEIIHKCSTLNLPKLNKTKHGNLKVYATVSNSKDKVEEKKIISIDQTDSNRVVYSIVFDG